MLPPKLDKKNDLFYTFQGQAWHLHNYYNKVDKLEVQNSEFKRREIK